MPDMTDDLSLDRLICWHRDLARTYIVMRDAHEDKGVKKSYYDISEKYANTAVLLEELARLRKHMDIIGEIEG